MERLSRLFSSPAALYSPVSTRPVELSGMSAPTAADSELSHRQPHNRTPSGESKDDIKDQPWSESTGNVGAPGYSVFDDALLAKHFVPPDEYENKHRFDRNAVWTKEEEDAVRRKCDYRITAFVCLAFAALQLDRGNISSANSDNFLADLGMTTDQYNDGQTVSPGHSPLRHRHPPARTS